MLGSRPARAAEEETEAKPAHEKDGEKDGATKPAEESPAYGHAGQIGVRAGLVGGYRMIFRYDDSPFCAEPDFVKKQPKDQQKFCGHAAPFATELAVSFALIDSLEPYLWSRIGLQREKETDTNPLLAFGAGVRIYTMSDSAFKIFIEPAIGWEVEGGGDDPLWQTPRPGYDPKYKKDMLFHLAAGPQLDLAKAFGIYLDAGLTTGILRAIHSNLELQLGFQLRVK
jgi:hypothetical protein